MLVSAPPSPQTQDQSHSHGAWGRAWGWGCLAGRTMGVLTTEDLGELKGQGPGMSLSNISGAGVLKVNRRILRT